MLSLPERSEGIETVKCLILQLTKGKAARSCSSEATITARVGGKTVVERGVFPVQMTFDGTNRAVIDVHWEDGNYAHYRDLGLYGSFNTDRQHIESRPGGLLIRSDGYEVVIVFEP